MTEQTLGLDRPDDPPAIRIGDVLGRSLRLYARPFAIYVALTAVLILPADLIGRAVVERDDDGTPVLNPHQMPWVGQTSIELELLVLGPTAQALVQAWAFPRLSTGRSGLRQAIRRVVRRWPAVMATTFCYYLFVMIGWATLAFPGVIIAVWTMVAAPACLLEDLGPIAAFRRSLALTRGNRWRIFGLYLACAVPLLLAEGAASVAAEQLAGPDIADFVDVVLRAATTAFFAVLTLVLYHTLRIAHHGIGAEQIAAVFD